MSEFHYQPLFELGDGHGEPPGTTYRKLTSDHVSAATFQGREVLMVEPQALTLLAEQAFDDVSHLLRTSHLRQLRKILDDPEASDNDRFVALELLKNANIAAGRVLPGCQDTGTAIIHGRKGELVFTGADDEEALSRGVYNAYTTRNLRYSQMAPLDMFLEKNTGTNLPAQIEVHAETGDEYHFMFVAKGGGLGQQDVSVPGDQGATQSGVTGAVGEGPPDLARYLRLPALSPGSRDRWHFG